MTTTTTRYFAIPLDSEGLATAAEALCEIVSASVADGVLGSDLTDEERAAVALPRVVQPEGAGSLESFLLVPRNVSADWLADACGIHAECILDRSEPDEIGESDACEDLRVYIGEEIGLRRAGLIPA